MNLLRWLRAPRLELPDIERLQACVDAVDRAADIAYPSFTGNPRKHIIRTTSNAQAMADYYARVWFLDAIDAELFALEAAIAEEAA